MAGDAAGAALKKAGSKAGRKIAGAVGERAGAGKTAASPQQSLGKKLSGGRTSIKIAED